jgi:hypothetical protein
MLQEPAGNDDEANPQKGNTMRLFIFKSEAKPGLLAFGGDLMGSQLPKQFKPWRAIGAVGPDRAPPHELSRDVIETAIKDQGFQLWRMKKKDQG